MYFVFVGRRGVEPHFVSAPRATCRTAKLRRLGFLWLKQYVKKLTKNVFITHELSFSILSPSRVTCVGLRSRTAFRLIAHLFDACFRCLPHNKMTCDAYIIMLKQ